jgi:hypothetical protein
MAFSTEQLPLNQYVGALMQPHLFGIIGLAIGFVAPAIAQEKSAICDGPQEVCSQITSLIKRSDAAYNRKDAAGDIAIFASDGVFVMEGRVVSGTEALEKLERFPFALAHGTRSSSLFESVIHRSGDSTCADHALVSQTPIWPTRFPPPLNPRHDDEGSKRDGRNHGQAIFEACLYGEGAGNTESHTAAQTVD